MKLRELLPGHPWGEGDALGEQEIDALAYDSRRVVPGTLFFAIKGHLSDGHRYLPQAFQQGAVAAVVTDPGAIPVELRDRCLSVENARLALATASANHYAHPTVQLLTLGVTGTNGKTSCAYALAAILEAAGHRVALIGTIERRHPGRSEPSSHTTPESLELQAFLAEARAAGATAAVLEVSSHALALQRVGGCRFDGVLFTNLSDDHLDFHGDMEHYYATKRQLFEASRHAGSGKEVRGVINADDPWGARLLREATIPVAGFGEAQGDYRFSGLCLDADGIGGVIQGPRGRCLTLRTPLTGDFNRANLAASAALADQVGIPTAAVTSGLRDFRGAPGRLEAIPTPLPFRVYVDFAHSGDALAKLLSTLRRATSGRVIAVFGAGGDKPLSRRHGMGRAAAEGAELTIVTSDNPRSEEPLAIIDAIVTAYRQRLGEGGVEGERELIIEADRATAIGRAVAEARPGDVICIAGKGHETGQIIAGSTLPFDDREEARRHLREREGCELE